MSREDSKGNKIPTRRTFLGVVGASATACALGPISTAQAQAREAAQHVRTVTGWERWSVLNQVWSDKSYQTLVDDYKGENKRPRYYSASVFETDTSDGSYYSVVVPMSSAGFFSRSSDDESMIVWTTSDEFDCIAHDFVHKGGSEWTNTVRQLSESGIGTASTSTSAVIRETVTVDLEAAQREVHGATASSVNVQSTTFGCPDFDWQCVMSMASSFIGTSFSCGKCVLSGFKSVGSCVTCVSAVMGSGASFCDPCPDDDDWPFGGEDS